MSILYPSIKLPKGRLAVTIYWPLARDPARIYFTDAPFWTQLRASILQMRASISNLPEIIKIKLPPISTSCQILSFQLFQKSACSTRTICW